MVRRHGGIGLVAGGALLAGFLGSGTARADAPVPAAAGGGESERPVRERVAIGFGFGWVSPLADPYVAEGYGGGASLYVRIARWFGAQMTFDVAQHGLEGDLARIPYPYTNGDIGFGPVFEVTGARSPVALRLYLETGPYWSSYVFGLFWSWGLQFGSSLLWRMTEYLGLQTDLRYHLYNLTAIEDEEMLCPRTLQTLGALDRLDLLFSLVVTL